MIKQFYKPLSPKAIVRTNYRKAARKRILPETAVIGGSLTGIYLLTGLVLRLCGVQ